MNPFSRIFPVFKYLNTYLLFLNSRPSGWDSMKKISIVCENLQSMKPDDYYRNVIAPPVTRKV
jgi:hypothetical protein